MITSVYRSHDGTVLADLPVDAVAEALADGGGLLWVDIAADGRAEGEALLRDVFHFHQLTIDDCYNALLDPPKIDDYGAYIFVIVHDVRYRADAEALATAELDMYVGANFVVTVHRSQIDAVDVVRRRIAGGGRDLDRGADFLAHALFDVVVDAFHPVVDAIDNRLQAVEEDVLARPEPGVLQEVLRLRRNALRLKRSILPQRDVANRFSRSEFPAVISDRSRMYFRDVYDHTVRVEEIIDTVRDLAEGALNTYLSSVNNRTNEVMKTLAIVTVIFLPLTLISGIYGTNFEDTLPEYGWAPGFVLMLASMAVLSAALVAWFRWRRWF